MQGDRPTLSKLLEIWNKHPNPVHGRKAVHHWGQAQDPKCANQLTAVMTATPLKSVLHSGSRSQPSPLSGLMWCLMGKSSLSSSSSRASQSTGRPTWTWARTNLLPCFPKNYPEGAKFIVQQDGAPAHTAISSQTSVQWIFSTVGDSVCGRPLSLIWKSWMAPSWSVLQARARAKPHADLDWMKSFLQRECNSMSQDTICVAWCRFLGHLEAAAKASSGCFKI